MTWGRGVKNDWKFDADIKGRSPILAQAYTLTILVTSVSNSGAFITSS